jgi:hypothetical protein
MDTPRDVIVRRSASHPAICHLSANAGSGVLASLRATSRERYVGLANAIRREDGSAIIHRDLRRRFDAVGRQRLRRSLEGREREGPLARAAMDGTNRSVNSNSVAPTTEVVILAPVHDGIHESLDGFFRHLCGDVAPLKRDRPPERRRHTNRRRWSMFSRNSALLKRVGLTALPFSIS